MTRDEQREQQRAALAALADRGGNVAPLRVIDAARDPAHIFHDEFEWDDVKAAHRDRLVTAAKLIRSCRFKVTVGNVQIVVPYYCSDPRKDEPSYAPTVRIARNADLSRRVLQDELARIEGSVNRGRALALTFGLANEFDQLLEGVIELRRRLEDIDDAAEATAAPPMAPG